MWNDDSCLYAVCLCIDYYAICIWNEYDIWDQCYVFFLFVSLYLILICYVYNTKYNDFGLLLINFNFNLYIISFSHFIYTTQNKQICFLFRDTFILHIGCCTLYCLHNKCLFSSYSLALSLSKFVVPCVHFFSSFFFRHLISVHIP